MTWGQALEYSIKHFDCIIIKGYSAEAVSLSDSLLFVWMCKHMFSPEQCWQTNKRFEQLIIIVVEIVKCVLYDCVKGVMYMYINTWCWTGDWMYMYWGTFWSTCTSTWTHVWDCIHRMYMYICICNVLSFLTTWNINYVVFLYMQLTYLHVHFMW